MGIEKVISWHYTQLKSKKGEITDLLLSGEDISMQKEIDKLKTEFVNVVSHEIRTPISGIMGFVELMLTREMSKEKTFKYLNVIHKETKRLADLINDVLDLQRIESGKQVFEMEDFNFSELIEDVLMMFKENASHNIIENIRDANIAICADYNKIEQVLMNLLSNAVKYSPGGGDIVFGVQKAGDEILVWVKDSGLGIPREDIPKLFAKFFRVSSHSHQEIKGTGLGLCICKEIVQAHGGEIWVDSTQGKGSTFSFTLPVNK